MYIGRTEGIRSSASPEKKKLLNDKKELEINKQSGYNSKR
jgi:hypothetical protein